jgi:rod shape-determining protein MreC
MEHTPPPFFKRGPAPVVRLAFFASLSIALLLVDARFRYLEELRSVLATAVYPLQEIATAPIDLAQRAASFFQSQTALRAENAELKAQLLLASQRAQRNAAAAADAVRLRRLVGSAERLQYRSTPAEILYSGRDPFARTLIIDKGTQQGVRAGSPVVDDVGVIGQVTHAYPLVSEVTLVTDKDQAVPVQVVRNGLRAIIFGDGDSGMMNVRFMAPNVEIQDGDRLVTSGLDGTYPPGLPVATVVSVERDATRPFARIVCRPVAGVDRGRYVLVLSNEPKLPAYPTEAGAKHPRRQRESHGR